VTDFGEFLAIPGCTAGEHNPTKTAEPKVESINTGKKERPEFTKERDASNYGQEKIISAPPQRDQLQAKELADNKPEDVIVVKPKILNSLKSELAKMELEDKNKAKRSKIVEGKNKNTVTPPL